MVLLWPWRPGGLPESHWFAVHVGRPKELFSDGIGGLTGGSECHQQEEGQAAVCPLHLSFQGKV